MTNPQTNDQIKAEIAAIKKEYTKTQTLRRCMTLSAADRDRLNLAQSARVRRVAGLENVLTQRFKFN